MCIQSLPPLPAFERLDCWKEDPKQRPTFQALLRRIETISTDLKLEMRAPSKIVPAEAIDSTDPNSLGVYYTKSPNVERYAITPDGVDETIGDSLEFYV